VEKLEEKGEKKLRLQYLGKNKKFSGEKVGGNFIERTCKITLVNKIYLPDGPRDANKLF